MLFHPLAFISIMCQCTHTHTTELSLRTFQSLVNSCVGCPCPDCLGTRQCCCLPRQATGNDICYGYFGNAQGLREEKAGTSGVRLGWVVVKMCFILPNCSSLCKQNKHPCKLLICTKYPRMSVITWKSKLSDKYFT